ncbi:MAG: alpha/beta hydrolase-fold protein [Gemmatimonadota bacterium]
MRALTLLALLLLPTPLLGQGRYQEAVQIGTVDSIWSASLEEQRPFLVYTPPSYGDAELTPQQYPVLYLLDGNAHFHSVSGLIQILGTGVNGTFVIPEMIVVAIPNTDRTRDLTPTHTTLGFDGTPAPGFETSGGNDAFFRFLKDELIPHIDSRYRTLPYRVFVGHSLGGITAINALYSIPETFNAYVAIDPSLWWDNSTLLHQAKAYFSTARLDGKALYVAQANTIQPDDSITNPHFSAITQFDAVLSTYNESGLRYAFHYYKEDDHGSVPLISEYDALRFIFDGYKVPLQRVLAQPTLLTEHFRNVSARLGQNFQPSERMFALLAQVAVAQDTANALEFGRMRVQLYPQSSPAHEGLADLLAAQGQTDAARQHYEHALARSPDSERVQKKLRELGR